ncbi:MAG: V-type ATP synthase subunit I [Eubacteriales bacterium]|nr:V-type ATP synthase subunit I [Eubacteriales bacterium]
MAIVKMARAQLTAFASERDQLLRDLQALSLVHFADLNYNFVGEKYEEVFVPDEASEDLAALRDKLALVETAIKGLDALEAKPGFLAGLNSALPEMSFQDAESQVKAREDELMAQAEQIRQLLRDQAQSKEDEARLRDQKQQLLPFQNLDVSLSELDKLQRTRYVVGLIPKKAEIDLRHALAALDHTYFLGLSQDEKSVYFLVLYTEQDAEAVGEALQRAAFSSRAIRPDLTVPAILSDYDKQIADLRVARTEIEKELQQQSANHLAELKLLAEWLRNEEVRLEAREQFIRSNHVFLLELYVPAEQLEELRSTVDRSLKLPYSLDCEIVERDDKQVEEVPILLENNKLVEPFENVVTTFATPRYDELDPSGVVMPWYAACFAFMLGDAGYGLVLFILTTLALSIFKMKQSTRKTLRFFQILSVPSILVGLIFGSFFAVDIPQFLPFIGILSPTRDTDTALTFSMGFGVVMLFFGLAVLGYMKIRDKDTLGLVADVLSWYAVVIGAILMIFGQNWGLGSGAQLAAKIMLVLGLILVLVFSARDEKSWGARLGWGAYNVYGVTSWIGDIVSYARLAALAMAGGFIGYAVNLIASMLGTSIIGKVGALVVLLIFHPFNLFLSCLSAYVHTLRLIYVEFFGKFYEGGGKPFRRFRAESEYVDIK